MRLRDVLIAILCIVPISNFAQNLPHPKYNLRYHFTHFDHPLNGVENAKLTKALHDRYQAIGNDSNKIIVNINDQLGYDTIRSNSQSFLESPFYIQRHEVTNLEYLTFLNDTTSKQKKEANLTKKWLSPDESVWFNPGTFNEPYRSFYFKHKAYSNYPVVGVSQYQATAYCNWLEEKLNTEFANVIPKGYTIIVDLPTAAEFYTAVDECILKPHRSNYSRAYHFSSPVFRYIFETMPPNSVNFREASTDRMATLCNSHNLNVTSVEQEIPKGYLNVHHLLGNVSEWTSTRAMGHLYNNKDYIYTTLGKIIPNLEETHKPEVLSTYLRSEPSLQSHFVIKGGSWYEDLFYLDPSSVQLGRGDKKTAYIGFRTVIRLKAL